MIWQDEKNFIRFERSKQSTGGLQVVSRVVVEMYKDGKEVGLFYRNCAEVPMALVAIRKGGSVQLLLAAQGYKPLVFQEMAVDFRDEVFVGVSASNLSKRPFKAKLANFMLANLEGAEIEVKPVAMTSLVNGGMVKRDDGSWVLEGASMKVVKTVGGPAAPQMNMSEFSGKWSDDRQLLWKAAKTGESLTLEAPVDVAGKYDLKARFTQAPDYAQVKFELDGKPLNQGKPRGPVRRKYPAGRIDAAGLAHPEQGEASVQGHRRGEERQLGRLPVRPRRDPAHPGSLNPSHREEPLSPERRG